MRLYPKKLNSTAELMAEKQLLKLRLQQIDGDGMLSLKPRKKTDAEPAKKNEGNLLGDILGSGTVIDIALKLLPMLTGKSGVNKTTEKKGPNLLVKGLIEFGGGYLKWKAIELSYKGLKSLISKSKKNA